MSSLTSSSLATSSSLDSSSLSYISDNYSSTNSNTSELNFGTKTRHFSIGDRVKLIVDLALLKELQEDNHGGWNNKMSKVYSFKTIFIDLSSF